MRLASALVRLPVRFDPAPLADALAGLRDRDWLQCRGGSLGSAVVPLVAVGGTANLDFSLAGPARETAALARLPVLRDILALLAVPVARARLARLPGATRAPAGVDWNHHWYRRAPICVPLITDPAVTITCGEEAVHMAAGEAWVIDSARSHRLDNASSAACVHLIVETRTPFAAAVVGDGVHLEPYRFEVLDDAEMSALTAEMLAELATSALPIDQRAALADKLSTLRDRWTAAFGRFGHDAAGELAYQDILCDFREQALPKLALAGVGMSAARVVESVLTISPPAPRKLHRPAAPRRADVGPVRTPDFDRPLFVVSAPRAGSTLLFDLLRRFPGTWSLGEESHELIRGVPALHPGARGYVSDRLTDADATPTLAADLRDAFAGRILDRDGDRYGDLPDALRPASVRLVEKTPANALRIPFLRAVFPGAVFVHLRRDPRETISSLVEGWRSRRFVAYRDMPGWPHRDWSFLLPPGWRALAGRSLVEICAFQWRATTDIIEADLRACTEDSVRTVDYEDLIARPRDVLATLADFAGWAWDTAVDAAVSGALPLTRVTLSAPAPDKWRRHEAELAALLPAVTRAP